MTRINPSGEDDGLREQLFGDLVGRMEAQGPHIDQARLALAKTLTEFNFSEPERPFDLVAAAGIRAQLGETFDLEQYRLKSQKLMRICLEGWFHWALAINTQEAFKYALRMINNYDASQKAGSRNALIDLSDLRKKLEAAIAPQ